MKIYGTLLVAIWLTAAVANAQNTTTLTGKIVDVATYVTSDHNMDSMKMREQGSTSMSGSMSSEHAMAGEMKEECRALGVLSSGKLTLLATQMGSRTASKLCGALGKTVTLTGKSYARAGLNLFLVDSAK